MLRLADIGLLALFWLAALAMAVRWGLRRRATSTAPAMRVAGVAAFAIAGAFVLTYALHAADRSPTPAPQPAGAPAAPAVAAPASTAQPLHFAALDSLRMLGNATAGRLDIAPGAAHAAGNGYSAQASLVLTGWIAEPSAKSRGGPVFLLIDGHFRYPGLTPAGGAPRNGFALALPLDRVGVGDHYVQAAVRSPDGSGFYLLPRKVSLNVVP